jgi:hypothetical protein
MVGSAALLIAYLVSRPTYYVTLQEDYPVEWLQFALCLFTAVLAAATAARVQRRSHPFLFIALLLAALAFAFLCLEEISWGQRVLGLDTPAALRATNAQDEINVHNVQAPGGLRLQDVFKLVSFGLGCAGAAAIALSRARSGTQRPLLRTLSPPAYALPGFLGVVLYWPAVLLLPFLANPLSRMQEWVEASLYVAFAMTLACIYIRCSAAAPSAGSRPFGRSATRRGPDGTWRVPLQGAVVVLLITTACAISTARNGIVPGNVTVASLASTD